MAEIKKAPLPPGASERVEPGPNPSSPQNTTSAELPRRPWDGLMVWCSIETRSRIRVAWTDSFLFLSGIMITRRHYNTYGAINGNESY